MATELQIFNVPGLTAAASLAAKQFYCVKKNTSDNQVAICDTDGEVFLGVLQNDPASGKEATVMALGVTKVIADETLTAGDLWKTSSDGQAAIAEGTVTGADVGDYVAGVVLVGAAAGALATVTIGVPSFRVEAQ